MRRGSAEGTTDAGAAVESLVEPIVELDQAFTIAARAMTEPSGLTPARWRVLSAVRDRARTVPAVAIRVRMGMTRQAVQRIADELVASGHAQWRENPEHRRSKLLESTQLGFEVLDEIIVRQVAWANAVGERIETSDIPGGVRMLNRVLRACVDIERESGKSTL